LDGANYTEMLSKYIKTLKDDDRAGLLEFLENLPEDLANVVIDTGIKFYKSSAVNGNWFWRTVQELAPKLSAAELLSWLEEGAGISRGTWDCSLSFLKACPDVLANTETAVFLRWTVVGRILIRYSNKDAEWYFKNSGTILGSLDKSAQERFVAGAARLLELSWNSALACMKAWPEIIRFKNAHNEEKILEKGLILTEQVPDEASAFFEAVPKFLQNVSLEHLAAWLEASLVLRKDQRGLISSFFRHTPDILSKVEFADLDQKLAEWAGFGAKLADHDDKIAVVFFAYTQGVLKYTEWDVLNNWVHLIEQVSDESSVEGAVEFVRHTPELLIQLSLKELAQWARFGLDVIKGEKRFAYFSLKSQESRDAIARYRTGLHLEAAKKILLLYSEALTGELIIIRNTLDLPEMIHGNQRLWGSFDTRRIYLPDLVKEYEDDQDNLRMYRVMMMHLISHRQFGTLALALEEVRELAENRHLGILFELIEDNRVDYLAAQAFHGLTRDIDLLISKSPQGFTQRGSAAGLSGPGKNSLPAVINYLTGFFRGEQDNLKQLVPGRFHERYQIFWEKVEETGASAAESLHMARIFLDLIEELGWDKNGLLKAGNLKYRGNIRFDLIYLAAKIDEKERGPKLAGPEEKNGLSRLIGKAKKPVQEAVKSGQEVNFNSDAYLNLKKLLSQFNEDEENPYRMVAYYDEWDRSLNDYKKDWCRVREVVMKPSSGLTVAKALEEHGGLISTLKRYFGMLRPDRFAKYGRQEDGEDIDIDAVVEAMVELQADVSPDNGFYIRRDKRERNVAVGFLLDLSYSTEEKVAETEKTLLDVEIESVVVMAEALEVLDDSYAIYGFHSDNRDKVNFYVVKDFEETYTDEVKMRFGGLKSYGMTRLAAAVRHAVAKMEKVQAAIKILIILSDGRPFDFDYNSGLTKDHEEFYAETDTRVALREAKMKGINPFCITVDNRGQDYLEYIYGNVSYIIIDDVNALPAKLTETYKNLTT